MKIRTCRPPRGSPNGPAAARSLFERFSDLHPLRIAAADHAIAQATAQAEPRHVDGDRQARLKAHVETRGRICEQWMPMWRAINANQGDSAALESRILQVRQAIAERIELTYRAELSTLPEPERRRVVIVIEMLIDFESWAYMRENVGLSVREGRAVWIGAIDRLLPPTPPIS